MAWTGIPSSVIFAFVSCTNRSRAPELGIPIASTTFHHSSFSINPFALAEACIAASSWWLGEVRSTRFQGKMFETVVF